MMAAFNVGIKSGTQQSNSLMSISENNNTVNCNMVETEESNSTSESDGKGLAPELPDLKKFKNNDGVSTPPSE